MVATVARAHRFFQSAAYRALIPQDAAWALCGFLDELMRFSAVVVIDGEQRLIVDASRPELARRGGVSVGTVRNYEKRLAAVGLLRIDRLASNRRRIEIVRHDHLEEDPSADRAVDNSVDSSADREGLLSTGYHHCYQPIGSSRPPVLMSGREGRESRQGRPQPARTPERPAAQSAQSADLESKQVARGIVAEVRDRLRSSIPADCSPWPWTLSSAQAAQVEDRVAQRIRAITRGSVSTIAIKLARTDVQRVLSYALKTQKPAAYLFRAITSSDWRSEPAPDSQAARVNAAGRRAEMPVQDLASRAGPAVQRSQEASPAERAALESVLEVMGASQAHRAAAARVQGGDGVRRLTQRLTAAYLADQARLEVHG